MVVASETMQMWGMIMLGKAHPILALHWVSSTSRNLNKTIIKCPEFDNGCSSYHLATLEAIWCGLSVMVWEAGLVSSQAAVNDVFHIQCKV